MKKIELKILIVVIAVFLLLFILIPENKEELILAKFENSSNVSGSEVTPIDYIESDSSSKIIVSEIMHSNGTLSEVDNLSDKEKFILDKELSEKNKVFVEMTNSTD